MVKQKMSKGSGNSKPVVQNVSVFLKKDLLTAKYFDPEQQILYLCWQEYIFCVKQIL